MSLAAALGMAIAAVVGLIGVYLKGRGDGAKSRLSDRAVEASIEDARARGRRQAHRELHEAQEHLRRTRDAAVKEETAARIESGRASRTDASALLQEIEAWDDDTDAG